MVFFTQKIEEILKDFDTDAQHGLTSEEVEARIRKYGLNEFEEEKKDTLLKKLLYHLSEIPTIILMLAAVIASVAAVLNAQELGHHVVSDWAKVAVILSIVVINVVLGLYQEGKAEKALEALKQMNSYKTTVIRRGIKHIIEANQLVPGDIVELNTGDVVTADSRLIEASSLQTDEAALTGESLPVDKEPDIIITETCIPVGDRKNMVYSGCLVTGGRATAVVVATGMQTEMGKIAKSLVSSKKMLTPLQQRLKQLAKRISIVAMVAAVAMLIVGSLFSDLTPIGLLLLAVALGVAAVPETLPIVVTMILSYGVFNMVSKKTIIRKIPAIETIGNTSVICSDKTGTLTLNKMKIQQIWHVAYDEPKAAKDVFSDNETYLLEMFASCSNATIEVCENEDERVMGDPTEIAIIRLLHDKGLTRVDAERKYPRIHELPFDSGRKRMTTVHYNLEDGYIVVTKGAFDRLPVAWGKGQYERAAEIHDQFANKALRVLAIGYKIYDKMPDDLSADALEKDLTFLGMVGMIDPPRPESKDAVAKAKEAGIKTVMITGDHIGTAIAIAKEIGIMEEGDRALSGAELAEMSDVDLAAQVRGISVYARVSPEDKMRIVHAWHTHNAVVTMTGDGVNDAPALKAADVGAAMGITGTEVSKNAADMVITDDNFATIVDAIAEGRTSYDNIRKIIQFLLGVNFAEIFILLFGMIAFRQVTITAMQILIINVVYDGLPGFFLTFEKAEPGVMKRKPLPKGSGVFAGRVGFFIAARAATFSILTLTAFVLGSYVNISPNFDPSYAIGTTMAFMVLGWASCIDIFNTRTSLSIFKAGFLTNKGIFLTVVISIALSVLVALWEPTQAIFGVVNVSGTHWLIIVGLAVMQVVMVEIIKFVMRIRDKRKQQPA